MRTQRSPAQSSNRKSRRLPAARLVNPAGGMNVERLGVTSSPWNDLYHLLLTIPWTGFLALISLLYLGANAFFALAYLVGGDGIENARPGSFADAFFFSVQTMASIGYGSMYPRATYAHLLVTAESLLGLLWLATASGLIFARFSRPTALVLFSRVAVITSYDGLPTLMLRAANQRHNQILEAQVRLTLVRNIINHEGQFMRRFYDMELLRSQSPVFALTWTVMHPIDQQSPLHGMTAEDLAEMEAEIVITLTGIDETFSQTIHARYSYVIQEILWDRRFVDILTKTSDGRRAIDYTRFHDVTPS